MVYFQLFFCYFILGSFKSVMLDHNQVGVLLIFQKILVKAPHLDDPSNSNPTKLEVKSVQMIIFIYLRLFEYCELTVLTILIAYIFVMMTSPATSLLVTIFQILRLVPVCLLSLYFIPVPIRLIFVAISITEKPPSFVLFCYLLVSPFVSGIFLRCFFYNWGPIPLLQP